MEYKKEVQLVNYLNKYVNPQDLKLKKIILTSQLNKSKEAKIYIELRRYNAIDNTQKRKRISTDIWVNPKHWSTKKEEVLKSDFDYQDKNRVINDLYSRIYNYVNNPKIDYVFAQLKREEFLMIEEIFPSKRLIEYKKSLANYIEDYIEYRKSTNTVRNTTKEFTTMLNRVKNFDIYMNKKTMLNDVNFTWSENFEIFLRNHAINGKKIGYDEGTIEKTYTILITVLNHYYKKKKELGLDISDIFREKGFKKGRKSKNEANPLNNEQLSILINHEFQDKTMQLMQDRFIWQCYTGIRYIDAFRIGYNETKNNWLKFTPSKTERHNIEVNQPLHPTALKLLEKYQYDMTKLKITNQAYNRGLKAMFAELNNIYPELKYDVNFGSYASRDTFITRCVQAGIDWKTILLWVGQSSYTIMDRYIGFDKEFGENQMKKLK